MVTMVTSSEQPEPSVPDVGRDDVEGNYTKRDSDAAGLRTVHGQYTESDGQAGPDPSVEGTYIGADHHGESPLVRAAVLRHGNYPKAEH
jgi:hypothetical protein